MVNPSLQSPPGQSRLSVNRETGPKARSWATKSFAVTPQNPISSKKSIVPSSAELRTRLNHDFTAGF